MTHTAVEATLLLTDIEGSTALAQRLGDDWIDSLERHNREVRIVLARFGGSEARNQGDSFFAVFDEPANAVRAAVEIQRALEKVEWAHGHPIKVRMGLHHGEVVPLGDDFAGVSIHLAARIMGAAHGGQIVLSNAALDAVGNEFSCVALGAHLLKDFAEPVTLHQLVAPGLTETFPPLVTIDARDHNLPSMVTRFVGREAELADLRALLSGGARLISLEGPGGVGKTRLALEAAWSVLSRFRAGAWFVDFTGLGDPARILDTIADTLGVHAREGENQLDAIAGALASGPALLVLDNLEHLVSGAVAISDLLRRCPNVVAIVTSRERLRLQGEHELNLDGLARDDAAELFANRALLVRRDFVVNDEVRALCARLDHLPLAIELAAARLRTDSVGELLAAMDNMLDVLTGGERDRPARHQTVRAMIAVSVEALTEAERSVFRAFSVFAGGATRDVINAVCSPKADEVASLVDKSLLRVEDDRFTMLEPIRQFAEERLAYDVPGERQERSDAHARVFLELAERLEPALVTADQRVALDALAADHANLRVAIERGVGDVPLRIASALVRYWIYRGFPHEGRATLARVLAGPGVAPTQVRANALVGAAQLAILQHDLDAAEPLLAEALPIATPAGTATVRNLMGELARIRGELDDASKHFAAAQRIAEEAQDDRALGVACNNQANIALAQGDAARSAEFCRRAIEVSDRTGDLQGAVRAVSNLGLALRSQGDARGAIEAFERSRALAQFTGNRGAEAVALQNIAGAMQAMGTALDAEAERLAYERLCEAAAIFESLGYKRELAASLMSKPAFTDDLEECLRDVKRAKSIFVALGDEAGVSRAEALEAALIESRC